MRKQCLFGCWLFAVGVLPFSSPPTSAQVSIGVSVRIGPPALPVYEQPVCPREGFIWIPGYWAWGPEGYFWVPGTWVIAPRVGWLWTPGYWGWGGGVYIWRPGYWGPHVAFYGGLNYAFGYTGAGYAGGYWRRGAFVNNRSATNKNKTGVHTTDNQTLIANNITLAATPKRGVFGVRDVVAARGATADLRGTAPNARGPERPAIAAPAARGEARPAPRGENPAGNARPNAGSPAERTAARPAERPQPEQPRGRPNNAAEPRTSTPPKANNRPEPRENGGKGEERR